MLEHFKNIAVVSLSTVGSRVLGLLRDVLIFAALGAGVWNSAFILAFTLPNLFRRLLGEGALSSAMVPVFSDLLEREGRGAAFGFLNQILRRLVPLLAALVAGSILLLTWLAKGGYLADRWALAAELSVTVMPYMIFICTAAVVGAGLNVVGRFAVAAATPMVLNLAMIGALLAGRLLSDEASVLVYWLCGGVLVGGALQLLWPALDLLRQGWRFREPAPAAGAPLAELWRLFLPGVLGAAVLQLNILVSRVLAFLLDEAAVSMLYLASRLMELPLGVFTISLATVFFPQLAKATSYADEAGFADTFTRGMRLVIAISLPAGAGLAVMAGPILTSLFEWGAFEARDASATAPLLLIYGLGLPFYSAATFATRGLHASKDMRTPVRIAVLCLIVNAVGGLVLMRFLGAAGLALANVLAALVQALLLWSALSRQRPQLAARRLVPAIGRIIAAAAGMAAACGAGMAFLGLIAVPPKVSASLEVLALVPLGAVVYLYLLKLLRFEEMNALGEFVARYWGKRSSNMGNS